LCEDRLAAALKIVAEPHLLQLEFRMKFPNAFTVVIPTRNNAEGCQELLIALMVDNVHLALPLRVLFLVNDTSQSHTNLLRQVVSLECFASLKPRILRASQNFLTCDESIMDTLGENLDAVDDYFVMIGNSDRIVLPALQGALKYIQDHELDLLLVGVMNREMHRGKVMRQHSMTPRHINPKNRLSSTNSFGPDIFSDAMSDYGPEAYTGYLGCQIFSRKFFAALKPVVAAMPTLWALCLGVLELTARTEWRIGCFPEIVTMRVDHLLYGPNSPQHPPDWWATHSRTERGFSKHLMLPMITNSLCLSEAAFRTLVNAQMVTSPRGSSQYNFSNFLYRFVEQVRDLARICFQDRGYQYSASELQDVVRFGERLSTVEIGLPTEQHAAICTWLQSFGIIGDYSNPRNLHELMASADAVLTLLDRRPGMERWAAFLQPSPIETIA
jgi:hypothetical protein